MRIQQEFIVACPREAVWTFLHDIPNVAACMRGAEYLGPEQTGPNGDSLHKGRVKFSLGPFSAIFEGKAKIKFDEADLSGRVDGQAVDKRGGSRGKLGLDFSLIEVPEGTKLKLDADVKLSGAVAQFGRTGLIHETTKILITDFSSELEKRLRDRSVSEIAAMTTTDTSSPLQVLGTAWRAVVAWSRNLLKGV